MDEATLPFGQWLKRQRRALDLTQEELAQQIGCALVTLRKIEAGDRRPSKQILERLAAILSIPPAEQPAFMAYRVPSIPTLPLRRPAARPTRLTRPPGKGPIVICQTTICPSSSPASSAASVRSLTLGGWWPRRAC